METQPKIEFQGFEPSSHLRELVESGIHKLDARSGRISNCSVVVRAPGGHHRLGEHYAVSIHIGLPNGRDVNVGGSESDRRHADVVFAITDSFRKATRQLRDEMLRLQGHVKQHSGASAKGSES